MSSDDRTLLASRMILCAAVLADHRKKGRDADPWFNATLREDIAVANSLCGEFADAWESFWKHSLFLPERAE